MNNLIMDNCEVRSNRKSQGDKALKHYSLSILKLSIPLFISFLFNSSPVFSQSKEGLTNIPDTSFTTYSAYISAKKKYPQIEIAEKNHSAAVKENYGIIYSVTGNRKLQTDIFSPAKKAGNKRTAVIIIFGGGWRSGSRSQQYPLAERLAALGYVCFTPDYRLSTEALYPAAVYDIKAAVRWVKKNAGKYYIDTSRLAVLGFSAGGELAAFTGVTNGHQLFEGMEDRAYSSEVHAVIDIDGILSFVHPESGEGDDSKKRSAATYWFGYSKEENPALWKQASPLTHAGPASPPILFINSSVERMHAGRNDYIEIMNRYHIYTEVKSFENSPHTFCLFHPWFDPTVKYIDEFLKKVF